MADRKRVMQWLETCANGCEDGCPYEYKNLVYRVECKADLMSDALELLKAQAQKWIPFIKRPLTEEEQKNHPGWCYTLDGEVPDDEQEILLYRPWKNKEGYIIEMDRYINNGDTVYLEGAMDIENGMFWMPLPEPPKEVSEDG